jgi:hypothetical protein
MRKMAIFRAFRRKKTKPILATEDRNQNEKFYPSLSLRACPELVEWG